MDNTKSLQIKEKWQIKSQNFYYFCSSGQMIHNNPPSILLLSFDDKLTILNEDGKQVTSLPFSSDITAIFIEDIFKNHDPVFVSMDIHGKVRVFSREGKEMWEKELPAAVVTGSVTNIDNEVDLEILVALENQELLILSNQGNVIGTYRHNTGITSLTVGTFHSSTREIIFSDQKDQLNFIDIEENQTTLNLNVKQINAITTIELSETFLVLATNEGKIVWINNKGKIVQSYQLSSGVRGITSVTGKSDDSLLIVSTLDDNRLVALSIHDPNHVNKKEKAQSKIEPLKITPKAPDHPVKPEIRVEKSNFSSFPRYAPQSTRVQDSAGIKVVNSRKVSKSQGTQIQCPMCGNYLPMEFEERVLNGIDTFCEKCGEKITLKDISH